MNRQSSALFHETQSLGRWHTRLVLAMPPAALAFIACRQLVWGHPWGSPPVSNGGLLFLTILLALVYVRLITVRLVTELRPAELVVGMRGLWRMKRIPLREVDAATVKEYDPVGDFGGYGIRSGRRGQACIARGNRGVELRLGSGRKIMIGSQHPEQLAKKIMEARACAA